MCHFFQPFYHETEERTELEEAEGERERREIRFPKEKGIYEKKDGKKNIYRKKTRVERSLTSRSISGQCHLWCIYAADML